MNRHLVRVVLTVGFLALPLVTRAQDATLTGTITDTTGGVLPGVTITAIHEESGNTFVGVTDGSGVFRLPVRIGLYRVTGRTDGLYNCRRTGLQVQVGQLVTLSFQMAPSTVQETVTVTGEAPLIEVNTSTAAANIDQRQMQELPLNGRNWLDLTLLAPGSRANTAARRRSRARRWRSRSTWMASRSPTAWPARASDSRASAAIRSLNSSSSRTASTPHRAARWAWW